MSTFRRYLAYRLEQSMLRTLIFTAISVLFTQTVIHNEMDVYISGNEKTGLYAIAIVLGVFCTVIPILELSGFKNRRNLDTLYFLPISRKKLAVLNFISGWIQILIIYTVTYLLACFAWLSKTHVFHLSYLLPYFLFSLCIGLIMYLVFLFLFGEANSMVDGVLFCVLGIFALAFLFSLSYNVMATKENDWFNPFWGCIYVPINNLTVVYQKMIHADQSSVAERVIREWYMFVVWGVIGVASAFGYFRNFVRKRAEEVGDISNSWFGYKIMIPFYGYYLMFILGGLSPLSIFVLSMMFAGYFIYRRSFKLHKSDIIVLICAIIPFLLGIIF